MSKSFTTLPLPSPLLDGLADAGYQSMTAVQAESLPLMLAGKDVIAKAQTGSGKTAAFALGLLTRLDARQFAVQSLVLCPTRELAEQVAEEIRKLARGLGNIKVLTLCGGVPARAQASSLEHGAQVLVGTPGRVLDHLNQERLDFTALNTLVLDEADRMLEMGFEDDLTSIVGATPATRQTLLFSATYPKHFDKLVSRVTASPVHVDVASETSPLSIEQAFYALETVPPAQAVLRILQKQQPQSCMVFCNTKREVQAVHDSLRAQQISVLALHGDLEQKDRDQTMVQFNNHSARVLVATDIAARGLDIDDLDLVISLHMAHDLDTHTHRVGRTGRAGSSGLAVTLIGAGDDYKLRLLEDTLPAPVVIHPLPAADNSQAPLQASMVTLQINGGKKQKLRPGDIVGALTRDNQIPVEAIGKIKLQSMWGFVAVQRKVADRAIKLLNGDKIKGKRFRTRVL